MANNLHDHLAEALAALVQREGGYAAVASAAGCNPQTLYQIVKRVALPSGKPKGVGRHLEDKLNRAFPGWADAPFMGAVSTSSSPKEGAHSWGPIPPLAHQLSLAEPSLASPPTIAWEMLLDKPLPHRFRVVLPDDSMALDDPPSMRAGDWAEFVPADSANPNQVVLVVDGSGHTYVRKFSARRPGHWSAVARHSGFQPLDSISDRLRIIAVQVANGWA